MRHRATAFRSFVAAIVVLAAASAFAHELNLFATVENGVIHGRAYYGDAKPAAGIAVQVVGPHNESFAALETDAEGRVTFTPQQPVRHTLIAQTPDGHRAQADVPSSALPESFHVTEPVSEVDGRILEERIANAVAREVRPLREQLDAYEHATRLRDVLGGIGYIVGAAGAFALLKARRKSSK